MIIRRISNSIGQLTWTAELTEYDANPPATAFTLDHAPLSVNPERQAVASYLMFGRWSGGEFEAPNKMGPATAKAIAVDAEPMHFMVQPIEYYPKALPIGGKKISLRTNGLGSEPNSLYNLRTDIWNGSLRSSTSIAVGSNSFVFKRSEDDIRPDLAVAVVFAEDLGADTIQLESKVDPDELKRLRRLLDSVRLGLETCS